VCDKSFSCRRYLLYDANVIQGVSAIMNDAHIRTKSSKVNTKSSDSNSKTNTPCDKCGYPS